MSVAVVGTAGAAGADLLPFPLGCGLSILHLAKAAFHRWCRRGQGPPVTESLLYDNRSTHAAGRNAHVYWPASTLLNSIFSSHSVTIFFSVLFFAFAIVASLTWAPMNFPEMCLSDWSPPIWKLPWHSADLATLRWYVWNAHVHEILSDTMLHCLCVWSRRKWGTGHVQGTDNVTSAAVRCHGESQWTWRGLMA